MRLSSLPIALGAIALACSPLVASAADDDMQAAGSKVFKLHAQNGSHEYGTVALKPHGSSTTVEIHLINAPDGTAQPAHIHTGSCSKLDPAPKYPLTSVLDGTSETTVKVPLATMAGSPMAVNIHKSANDLKDYVACADLSKS